MIEIEILEGAYLLFILWSGIMEMHGIRKTLDVENY